MFSKSFFVSLLVVALSSQAYAHAAIAPALGVKGTPVRGDAQKPSKTSPCGSVNVAQNIDTSTPIVASGNSFTATITNFNGGTDGSRAIKTMSVDATGTGKSFVSAAATFNPNGDAAPASTGSQQITGTLPAGTKCTGGKTGNLCLVSMTTDGGFGNCVVVQQGAAGASGAAAAVAAPAGSAASASAPAASASTAAKTGKGKKAAGKAAGKKAAGKKAAGNKAAGKKTGAMAAKDNKQTAARSWASRRHVRRA